jgi:hypothetical protein
MTNPFQAWPSNFDWFLTHPSTKSERPSSESSSPVTRSSTRAPLGPGCPIKPFDPYASQAYGRCIPQRREAAMLRSRLGFAAPFLALALIAFAAIPASIGPASAEEPSRGGCGGGNGQANDVTGTNMADAICVQGGNDRVNGRGGNDRVVGGSGRDLLWGSGDQDRLLGGRGSDVLIGGTEADDLQGGSEPDTLIGGEDADTLSGDEGKDIIDARDGEGDDEIAGGSGADV